MARKTRKFADGGSTARYDRKTKDIESDFQKALSRAGGDERRAAIARAKMEQRMADAKDDLAKWTGADRSASRAAEAAAERNLSMTRRYGPSQSRAAIESMDKPLDFKAPDLSGIKTPSLARAPRPAATPRSVAVKPRMDAARTATGGTKPRVDVAKIGTGSNLEEIRRKGAALRAAFTGPPTPKTTPPRVYKPTVSDVTATDSFSGNKRTLTPEQRRKLEEAVSRSGTRSSGFKKGGKIDGCAIRGKTRAPLKGRK